MKSVEFQNLFNALTGVKDPFPWQWDLCSRFTRGDFPLCCDLPTGLGKTSVVALWLIALSKYPEKIPRRLVYVVNRRTVVDQTTEEVEKLRNNLVGAGLDSALKKLCALECECPLAISTLRGQFADNREWSTDPCRPAIIVGTVDMIGSRLLFGGYGVGFKTKPLHAAFLGQDALLVHDEAHLEPAFQELLNQITTEQTKCGDARRLRVVEMSATTRGGVAPFGLTLADESHPTVAKRLNARKKLLLHSLEDSKNLSERLLELALAHRESGCAVIVFAQAVETVEKVATALQKAVGSTKVERLTGTLRGKERDELVRKPVFLRFLPTQQTSSADTASAIDGTVYLVCTSAGEVGVNISADHLICDLSTFESMAQRFGRVNRFGDRDDTKIDVVHPATFSDDDAEAPLEKTLELLRQLNGDASPNALRKLDPAARAAAFRPPPEILPVSDILFDAWSLSSIAGVLPGRPPLEPYLHGVSESDPPETHVAWREEVQVLDAALRDLYKPEELLEDYPLKPHELLRDRSDRVFKHLSELAKRSPAFPVWLIDTNGIIHDNLTLVDFADPKTKNQINHCTVLLPPNAGGLRGGMLDGTSPIAEDVADAWPDANGQLRRIRVWDNDPDSASKAKGMRLIREIDTQPSADEEEEKEGEAVGRRFWRWYERPGKADSEGSRRAQNPVTLLVHTNDVEGGLQQFVTKLALTSELAQAVQLAGRFHDLGKQRDFWQRSIGNFAPDIYWAKSGGVKGVRDFGDGYRHEFGSLLDALDEPELQRLSPEMKDVVLHLIASHHGRARPHFSADEAFDPKHRREKVNDITTEIPRRFAKLQRRYGRWGLAYLESLLRAADYAASAKPSQTLEDRV